MLKYRRIENATVTHLCIHTTTSREWSRTKQSQNNTDAHCDRQWHKKLINMWDYWNRITSDCKHQEHKHPHTHTHTHSRVVPARGRVENKIMKFVILIMNLWKKKFTPKWRCPLIVYLSVTNTQTRTEGIGWWKQVNRQEGEDSCDSVLRIYSVRVCVCTFSGLGVDIFVHIIVLLLRAVNVCLHQCVSRWVSVDLSICFWA